MLLMLNLMRAAAMADIKWIKLATNIFDNRKIRQIEMLPEGDSIIVIWVKLMCLAGVVNDGGLVYFTRDIPYTDEMLATEFNRPLSVVRLALATFQNFGMIEIVDNIIHLSSWEKYQSVEGMDRIREQTRRRVAAHRERQKLIASGNATCNATVTDCNAIEEDKEEEKEEEKERDKETYKAIVSHLNQKAGTAYKPTSKKTQILIKARLNEGFSLEDFERVIDNMCAEWLSDAKMQVYLRPETLFGTKFESYLNRKTRRSDQRHGAADDLDGIL